MKWRDHRATPGVFGSSSPLAPTLKERNSAEFLAPLKPLALSTLMGLNLDGTNL